MKQGNQWAQLAVAAILSAGIAVGVGEALADEEAPMEKCYGMHVVQKIILAQG
jgi:uncharacterized membrane protein